MSASDPFESFGARLRRLRRQRDLTQEQLGRLAGCSAAAVRKIEADERKPSRQLAELLASALQLPFAESEAFLRLARNLPAASPTRDSLPAPLTSLVNRVRDVDAVAGLLESVEVRWLTLIGPPGIGKTRLGIQAGRRLLPHFPDGVWFVDLARLDSAGYVLPAVARELAALGLPPSPNEDQLAAALKPLALLLVLDNFEHVTEAALAVAGLLKRCPGLKVLATSRVPVQIYGEYLYRVPALSLPPPEAARRPETLPDYEAVQLFLARARQVQPRFAPNAANAAVIVAICAALEGIPLALELAAASLQRMSLDELHAVLQRMDGTGGLRELSFPARDLPERQRTLENVVAWSWTLLTPPQQDLFTRLSVFAGGFDLDAAAHICLPAADTAAIRALLEELSDHSLLVRDSGADAPVWRMLDFIRDFAARRLEPERRAELEQRRAQYYLARLQAAAGDSSSRQPEAFFRLHAGNLDAAVNWAIASRQSGLGFELADLLDPYWTRFGYLREWLDQVKRLLALPDDSPPALRADRLANAADLAWQQHDFDTALDFASQAAGLGRSANLSGSLAGYINRLGRIHMEQGRYAEARQALDECLALAQANPSSFNPGIPLAQLGELAWLNGRLDEAAGILTDALNRLPDSEPIFRAIATADLAEIALARNDFTDARRWLAQAPPLKLLPVRRTVVHLTAAAGWLAELPGGREDQRRTAARLIGAVEGLTERSGVMLGGFYRNLLAGRLNVLRRHLSAGILEAELAAGRRLDQDSALAEAAEGLKSLKVGS